MRLPGVSTTNSLITIPRAYSPELGLSVQPVGIELEFPAFRHLTADSSAEPALAHRPLLSDFQSHRPTQSFPRAGSPAATLSSVTGSALTPRAGHINTAHNVVRQPGSSTSGTLLPTKNNSGRPQAARWFELEASIWSSVSRHRFRNFRLGSMRSVTVAIRLAERSQWNKSVLRHRRLLL